MRLEGTAYGKRNAKRLRKAMTPPEIALWLALRRNGAGLRFRKQHGADDYALDFFCAPARLVIEVDGEIHERGEQPKRDVTRDDWLRSQGMRVIRYGAKQVLSNLDGVVAQIVSIAVKRREHFEARRRPPPPSPSAPPPPGGGG